MASSWFVTLIRVRSQYANFSCLPALISFRRETEKESFVTLRAHPSDFSARSPESACLGNQCSPLYHLPTLRSFYPSKRPSYSIHILFIPREAPLDLCQFRSFCRTSLKDRNLSRLSQVHSRSGNERRVRVLFK